MSAGSPGSRSKASTVGRSIFVGERERWMELERGELGHPDQGRALVAQAVVDVALVAPAPHRGGLDPVRPVRRAALLEEGACLDAVRIALQGQRPVAEVGEDRVGDPRVVVDHLALGEAALGPQHLVEVGQLEPVPVYVYFAALALLRDLDLLLELLEPEPDLAAVVGLARAWRRRPCCAVALRSGGERLALDRGQALLQRRHQVGRLGRLRLLGDGLDDLLAPRLALDQRQQLLAVLVAVLVGVELAAQRLDQLPGHLELALLELAGRSRGSRRRAPRATPPRRRTASSPSSAPCPSAGWPPGSRDFAGRSGRPRPCSSRPSP